MESAQEYTPYPAARLAYFTPAEQEAMSRFTEMGVSGTSPELDVAGNIAGTVGMGSPYAGTMLETTRRAQEMPSMADPYAMASYMNPYHQLVWITRCERLAVSLTLWVVTLVCRRWSGQSGWIPRRHHAGRASAQPRAPAW